MRIACLIFRYEFVEAIAEACLRFSSQVTIAEGGIFIEIGKSRRLFTEEEFIKRVRQLFLRWNLRPKIGIADHPSLARMMAMHEVEPVIGRATQNQPPSFSIYCLSCLIDPWNPSNSKIKSESIEKFKKMGIQTLSQALQLPRKSIASRFGPEVLRALQNSTSLPSFDWPKWTPPEKIFESITVEESHRIQDLEPLLFLTKTILDRLCARLFGQRKWCVAFQLQVQTEAYSFVTETLREWKFQLSFPQGSALRLLAIIKERIDREMREKPLASPLKTISITISETVRSPNQQSDFFCTQEADQENLHHLISRLTEKLGADQVYFAGLKESHFPEKTTSRSLVRVKKNTAPIEVIQKVGLRPLRLLKNPIRIRRLSVDSSSFLALKKRRWKILHQTGPERIQAEWWSDHSNISDRDYFQVTTDQETIWIFECLKTKHLYLHGIFD